MKAIMILALLAGFSATASPTKTKQQQSNPVITKDTAVGPVTALKREIPDLFKNCTTHIVGDIDQPMYTFSCKIQFALDAKKEFVMNQNPVFRHNEDECTVEANYVKGSLVLFFGNPRAPTSYDEATNCLQKGTSTIQNKMDLLIFKTP